MEISKGIEIISTALYVKKLKTLILADLHLGYEEELNKRGILIPRNSFRIIKEKIKDILEKTEIERVIFNGDLKHEFGTISETEWRDTIKMIDMFKNKEIILIIGNHDKVLEPIAKKRNVLSVKSYLLGDILFMHGDTALDIPKGIKRIIIGHEHCAISLKYGARVEKYKCFLKGKWKNIELIAMPSTNPITEGTDILKEELLSPYLQQKLDNFEVYITGEEVMYFGKVKNLKKL